MTMLAEDKNGKTILVEDKDPSDLILKLIIIVSRRDLSLFRQVHSIFSNRLVSNQCRPATY